MRIFIVILVLIFSLQSLTKADISEFEIEEMSIGDSLLDHVSLERISSRKTHYYPKNKKYVGFMRIKEASFYDQVAVRVIDGDKIIKLPQLMEYLFTKTT